VERSLSARVSQSIETFIKKGFLARSQNHNIRAEYKQYNQAMATLYNSPNPSVQCIWQIWRECGDALRRPHKAALRQSTSHEHRVSKAIGASLHFKGLATHYPP
jgi:hypothetical protein